MSDYTTEDIQFKLSECGEIIIQMDSDGYSGAVELHLHDTEFHHDEGTIEVTLSDGTFEFAASAVESIVWHKQSTGDLGF